MTPDFSALGLHPALVETLAELEYRIPTPIQSNAIPHALAGRDVIGQAQTGTGKTAAFTLPALHHMATNGFPQDALTMLILTPTRELAIQVSEAVYRYGSRLGVRVLPIYGGQAYDRQERRLRKGVHVVVGTPGRTHDLIRKGTLDLAHVRYVVLDEADEMLKMGFTEDVEAILSATDANQRQTMLFSATFSDPIRKLAMRYMHTPEHITMQAETLTGDNIEQIHYVVQEEDKLVALARILETEERANTLIFAGTKVGAQKLVESLVEYGYPAIAIHGDLQQKDRERILGRFRDGMSNILVATDVVGRGVDITDISHVINYDIPRLGIEYVHRIGRTGRAGRAGKAITLVTPKQRRTLRFIEQTAQTTIEKHTLPNQEAVLASRNSVFKARLANIIESGTLEADDPLLQELVQSGYPPEAIIAGLLKLINTHQNGLALRDIRTKFGTREGDAPRNERRRERHPQARPDKKRPDRTNAPRTRRRRDDSDMVRLRMGAGRSNGIRPADVVFTVASKSGIPGSAIGAIKIEANQTYLDVPQQHVETVLKSMQREAIRGRAMNLERA